MGRIPYKHRRNFRENVACSWDRCYRTRSRTTGERLSDDHLWCIEKWQTVANFDGNYTTDELEKLLPEANFVVSVLPSTEETRGLLTYEHFQLLPDHAVFLNMGRGDLVSSEDILKAVKQQEIAHAVLDVFE